MRFLQYELLSTNHSRLESWFTNLEQTLPNRCQQLPAPYKRLIDGKNKKQIIDKPTILLTKDQHTFD